MSVQIIHGDCRDVLARLPAESVHCCVTSPPYWGLRDYGCEGQIGLEPDYRDYIASIIDVFSGVRRVLRDDGTVWLNLGDSYAAERSGTKMPAETLSGGINGHSPGLDRGRSALGGLARRNARAMGLKHKDLCGIPWRVAFALQADGWYLRSDIIWSKPNPMPESVTDRPTKAHEYLFLLAKSEKYYYDQEAIKEEWTCDRDDMREKGVRTGLAYLQQQSVARNSVKPRRSGNKERKPAGLRGIPGASCTDPNGGVAGSIPWEGNGRNKRTVWEVTTSPFPEAHFATFPPALIEPCILAGCPADGTVLDPFGGAGTTGLVADRLGRNAILIELNPEYAAMAERRIQADAPLFAAVSAKSIAIS